MKKALNILAAAGVMGLHSLAWGATVSGTVTYTGSQTGAVYVTLSQPRPPGSNQVLYLNGNGAYAITTLTDLSGSAMGGNGSALTVEYWFKGSVVQSAVRQQSSDYIVVGWNGLAILSNDGGTAGGLSLGAAVTDGNWHHVAMTWQMATTNGFNTYLDGALVASRNSSSVPIPNMDAQVYFGAFNGTAEFMDGMIDEVAIWDRALSPAEIYSNLRTGLTGNESGLAGYWNFDDGVGDDLTIYGNNVSLFGGAQIIHVDNPGLGAVFTQELPGPGAYQLTSVPLYNGCVLSAFMDAAGTGSLVPTDPQTPPATPFDLTGDLSTANLTLDDPPTIVTQPTNVIVNPGGTIVLSVAAAGSAPLAYQWFKEGVALTNGGRVSGALTSQLQVSSAQTGDAGTYTVTVTNAVGSAASAAALVLVYSSAAISGAVAYTGSQTGPIYVIVSEPRPPGSNQVLSLNGTTAYAATTLTDLSGSAIGGTGSALSVEYWFKGSYIQSAVRQQDGDYIVVGWTGEAILSNDGGVNTGLSLGATVMDGNWHHVAMTWEESTPNGFNTYLDGALVASRGTSSTPIPNMDAQVYFGSWNGTAEFMKGMIDEIAIWNRALLPAEIYNNMRTGLTGNEPDLAGYWNFDDGLGKDLTAYGNDCSLFGGAQIIHVDNPGLGPEVTVELSAVGPFQLNLVPLFNGCVLSAFMDLKGTGSLAPGDPQTAPGTPIDFTASVTGVNLTLYDPPAIQSQPTNVTVTAGGTAVLSVAATGAAPLSYQWEKLGVPLANGARISGAQTAQLQISPAQLGDEGPYTVVVTNLVGAIRSAPIALLVPSTNTTDGLVAHWTFDETSGDVAHDTSGSGLNGTVVNTSDDGAQWTNGLIGGALDFRGTNMTSGGILYGDYVTVPNFPLLTNTFSASAWVWADPRAGQWPQTTIIENGSTNSAAPGPIGLVLQLKNLDQNFGPLGDLFTDSVLGAQTVNDPAGLPTGAWQQIGVVANGSTMTLYRNGLAVASTNYSGLVAPPTSTFLGLGALLDASGDATAAANANGGYWQGKMDDVGVWNHALTASQMAALFLAGIAGKNIAQADPYLTAPPAILVQPTNQTLAAGEPLLLTVQAVGPGGLSYLWDRNGALVPGATNSSLYIASAQAPDSGQYTVVVSSPFGSTSSAPATVTVQATSISTALVGYWKFDETNGLTAADSSGYGDDGQLNNFPGDNSEWVKGQIGGALLFTAANQDYVLVPQYPAPTNTVTVSLWAYANSLQTWGSFVKNWGSSEAGQFHFGLYASGGQENIYIKQADGKTPNVSDSVVFPLDSWQHVAFVCDGSTVWLYRNGAVVASTPYDGTLVTPVTPAIGIGVKLNNAGTAADTGAPGYWDGELDDVAIWDRGLSPTEIGAVYRAGQAGQGVLQADAYLTPPTLTVKLSGKNVVLTWPAAYSGYVLESSPSLSAPSWTPVPGVTGTSATVPIGAGNAFFRLRD